MMDQWEILDVLLEGVQMALLCSGGEKEGGVGGGREKGCWRIFSSR